MCRRKIVNAGVKRVVGMFNGEIREIDVSLNNE
jgi:deoxycytidylate deaminase